MNILFFLTPKNEVAYVYEDETLRQTLEKMGNRRFSCIPILSREGRYVGTISEGDLLWTMMHLSLSNMKEAETIPIMSLSKRATYKPVTVSTSIEDLLDRAINQNFVPVIDDQGSFIGIVTRKAILKYCYAKIEQWQ
ncbi:MAG: CBS domain-containing protein [Blautia sp.]|nr:CBS domain-containing protein [Blautia sp.]